MVFDEYLDDTPLAFRRTDEGYEFGEAMTQDMVDLSGDLDNHPDGGWEDVYGLVSPTPRIEWGGTQEQADYHAAAVMQRLSLVWNYCRGIPSELLYNRIREVGEEVEETIEVYAGSYTPDSDEEGMVELQALGALRTLVSLGLAGRLKRDTDEDDTVHVRVLGQVSKVV